MRRALVGFAAAALLLLAAQPARADGTDPRSVTPAAPGRADATLTRGLGSSGYDDGFWIRRGAFSLKIGATLQARYEAWHWDDDEKPLDAFFAGGDLSGFSLPRATLQLSGTAPCNTSWYAELEFGHPGEDEIGRRFGGGSAPLGPLAQSYAYETLREAWIQWSLSDLFSVRVGKIATATTRQLMARPSLQQFVDVSLASAFVGSLMPGYTDRNRDHGLAVHGRIGARNTWSYLFTVTNGDGGDGTRNVLDGRTSDNLAFSGRINHAFLESIGYEEGALRQTTCESYGEIGAWAYYYADRADLPHTQVSDALRFGVDLALGYRGFSLTGAATWGSDENGLGDDADYAAYLVQLGYLIPGSGWEIAARWSLVDVDNPLPALAPLSGQQQPLGDGAVSEFALGLTWYLNGHGNKVGVDLAMLRGHDPGSRLLFDPYPGYQGTRGTTGAGADTYGLLLRIQWQLAL